MDYKTIEGMKIPKGASVRIILYGSPFGGEGETFTAKFLSASSRYLSYEIQTGEGTKKRGKPIRIIKSLEVLTS